MNTTGIERAGSHLARLAKTKGHGVLSLVIHGLGSSLILGFLISTFFESRIVQVVMKSFPMDVSNANLIALFIAVFIAALIYEGLVTRALNEGTVQVEKLVKEHWWQFIVFTSKKKETIYVDRKKQGIFKIVLLILLVEAVSGFFSLQQGTISLETLSGVVFIQFIMNTLLMDKVNLVDGLKDTASVNVEKEASLRHEVVSIGIMQDLKPESTQPDSANMQQSKNTAITTQAKPNSKQTYKPTI